jgi:2'-5' RNA ligase
LLKLNGLFLNESLLEDSVDEEIIKKGIMIALYPDKEKVKHMLIKDGVPLEELHVTLAYLGTTDEVSNLNKLKDVVGEYCKNVEKFDGIFGGIGRFNGNENTDGKDVLYASLDAPALPKIRQDLVDTLEKNGFEVSKSHGFTPHMTLTYFPSDDKLPIDRINTTPVHFNSIWLVIGEERIEFKLK